MYKDKFVFFPEVIREMNVSSQECLFIYDKEENLLPAEKLGMKIVLAKKQEQIVEDILAIIKSENKI